MSEFTLHPGQMVLLRNRPAVIRDLLPYNSNTGIVLNGVWVEYIDGFSHPDKEFVVWEREVQAKVIQSAKIPDLANPHMGIDPPDTFHTLINAYKWSSTNRLESNYSTQSDSIRLNSPFYSAIQIEPYQLYPLLKALTMPRVTMLIADDVGLGKTIEAGLILNEFIVRGRMRKMLILCPAALQIQWRDEMQEKFYLDFTVVNRESTYQLQKEFGIDSNPWVFYPRIITSFDYLRQQDILTSFEAACSRLNIDNQTANAWDMIIIDEAHNIASKFLGQDTDRLKMVKQIIPFFEHRLFLTATPHNGYTESFTGLLELLNPLSFEQKRNLDDNDLKYINEFVVRRLKSEFAEDVLVSKFSKRSIERISDEFHLKIHEKELFNALKKYKLKAIKIVNYEGGFSRIIVGFLISILTKRLLSSIVAFANTWWNHFAGIQDDVVDENEIKQAIVRAESDLSDDAEKDIREEEASKKIGSWLYRHRDELETEIKEINTILNKIGISDDLIKSQKTQAFDIKDSKWELLLDWINKYLKDGAKFKKDERVVIFTEYKHTLDYLLYKFKTCGIVSPVIETLFGGSSQNKREEIKIHFSDSESPLRILLVTDVASEGINLQNNCRYIIHYDIPWNPVRLEQRNGRVDRYGQTRDVTVFHYVSDEEADLKFLEKVVHKVEQIREDLGSVGELFDETIKEYFFNEKNDDKQALSYLDEIKPLEHKSQDLDGRDKGSHAKYQSAFENLKSTEVELNISPQSLAKLLELAINIEGGKLQSHPTEKDVYIIQNIPPKWKTLVKKYLTASSGNIQGGILRLVFDPSYFEESKNGKLIFVNKKDTKLIRLGHPIMKRAIGLLKKKLWDSNDIQTNRFSLSRLTISQAEIPQGINQILVLYVLLEANNKLKEIIHEQVFELAFLIRNGELIYLDDNLWKQIRNNNRNSIPKSVLNDIIPKFRKNWNEINSELQNNLADFKSKQLDLISEKLVNLTQEAESSVKQKYDDRLKELKERKGARYIEKLKKELGNEKLLLQQQVLYKEMEKDRLNYIRQLEIDLENVQNDKINYLETILNQDKQKMLNYIIPNRFSLNYLELHPLGVELIINEKLAAKIGK